MSQRSRRSHYEVLRVGRWAGNKDIRRAYRSLVREHHPDFSGSADASEFLEIQKAYETLSDPSSREVYDRSLEEAVPVRVAGQVPSREVTIEEAFSSGISGRPAWESPFEQMERERELFREIERLFARLFRSF